MTCLGSLCSSIAEKLSCTFDCSSTTTIEQNGPAVGGTINQLAAENFDLDQFSERCHAQNSGLAGAASSPLSPQQEIDRKIQWLGTELLGSNPADMKARVEYVLTVSGIDLRKKFKKQLQLTADEEKLLKEQVKKMKECGSYAFGLWKAVRLHQMDWPEVAREVGSDPAKHLRKKLSHYYADTVIGKESFARVDIAVKRVFMDVVALFPKIFKKQADKYESWDGLVRRNSGEDAFTDSSSLDSQPNSVFPSPNIPPRRVDGHSSLGVSPQIGSRVLPDSESFQGTSGSLGVRRLFDSSVLPASSRQTPRIHESRRIERGYEMKEVEPDGDTPTMQARRIQHPRIPLHPTSYHLAIQVPQSSQHHSHNLSAPALSNAELYSLTPSYSEPTSLRSQVMIPSSWTNTAPRSSEDHSRGGHFNPSPPTDRSRRDSPLRAAQKPVILEEIQFSEQELVQADSSPHRTASRLQAARGGERPRKALSVTPFKGEHSRGSKSADFRGMRQIPNRDQGHSVDELSAVGSRSGHSEED